MHIMLILETSTHVKRKSNKKMSLVSTQSAQITVTMNLFLQIPVMNSKSSMITKMFSIALDMSAEVKSQLFLSLLIDCVPNECIILEMIQLLKMLLFKVLFWNQKKKYPNLILVASWKSSSRHANHPNSNHRKYQLNDYRHVFAIVTDWIFHLWGWLKAELMFLTGK